MTVAELGRRMSARELSEWQEFYRHQPFGEWRADWRIAQLCHLFVAAHTPRGKTVPRLIDFMLRPLRRRKRTRAQTAEEQQEKFRAFTLALGGRIIGDDRSTTDRGPS